MNAFCWTLFSDCCHCSFLVGLLFTVSVTVCRSTGNREILVKLNSEEKLPIIQSQSASFGLEYVEKVSRHVHSFRKLSSFKKEDIHAFRQDFKAEIAEIQEIRYCLVNTYPPWGTPLHSREKRSLHNLFKRKNQCSPYYGMGVEEAWGMKFTGAGVNIAILDVGVEMNHPDLKPNINTQLGYDFVNKNRRKDFTPEYDRSYFEADILMDHGNNIAGLVASVKGNELCSGGVAYNASIIPLVVFELKNAMLWENPGLNDKHIASALTHRNQDIHIYSNSYNHISPFLQPKISMQDSLITGTREGRKSKGSIFVFSLGDKADGLHDGNMDFFANSIYTITIGSVAKGGKVPDYSIPCSCIIASALSEGKTIGADNFLTTSNEGSCTNKFKGNSAATGIGAAIIALGLHDKLSWRDVQYLLIYTSTLEGLTPRLASTINGAGLKYNPHFGYGMINATAFALAAKTWVPVSPQVSTAHGMTSQLRLVSKLGSGRPHVVVVNVEVKPCGNTSECVLYTEHVVAQLRYAASRERILSIQLCSPMKTCSHLLNDAYGTLNITDGKKLVRRTWNFTSVQFWGENPTGNWILVMKQYDKMRNDSYRHFSVRNLTLFIYGRSITEIPTSSNNRYLQETTDDDNDNIVQEIIDLLESPEELQDEIVKIVLESDTDNNTEGMDKLRNGGHFKFLYGVLLILIILPIVVFCCQCLNP